jgi:hypothetical protein
MKNTFTFLFLGLWLVTAPLFAQKRSAKLYVADIGVTDSAQTKRRNDEIKFQAKTQVNNLLELLLLLTSGDLTESQRTSVIQNSYLPNSNQIFYSDGVIVEDDIDPKHTAYNNTADFLVDRYLRNLGLFYSKSDTATTPTIAFTQQITSPVMQGKEYMFIKVFFTSTFLGKHNQFDSVAYKPVQRVAELRVEAVEGKWRTFITRLAFLQPDETLSQLESPVISKESGPKRPIDAQSFTFRRAGTPADSLTIKWDTQWLNVIHSSTKKIPVGFYQFRNTGITNDHSVSISLTNKDEHLTFQQANKAKLEFDKAGVIHTPVKGPKNYRIWGWIQIATGALAMGASYATYSTIRSDYNAYTSRLNTLNSEYAIWQTLTQQPGDSPAAPMPFNQYANPGIYASYGGTVLGGALIMNGIRLLRKAHKATLNSTK